MNFKNWLKIRTIPFVVKDIRNYNYQGIERLFLHVPPIGEAGRYMTESFVKCKPNTSQVKNNKDHFQKGVVKIAESFFND